MENINTENVVTIDTNKDVIVDRMLKLAQEIYDLGQANISNLCNMESAKYQMELVESRYMEVISQDKAKYPNEKSRDAALTSKCDIDPLYQQQLSDYNKAKNELANNKNKLEYNRNVFDTWLGYLNSRL